MRFHFLTFFFLLIISTACTQNAFRKDIDILFCDMVPESIVETENGDFLIIGRAEMKGFDSTSKFPSHTPFMFAYQLNNKADSIFFGTAPKVLNQDTTKTKWGNKNLLPIEGNNVRPTIDGGLILTGWVNNRRGYNYKGDRTQEVYLAKMNKNMKVEWTKVIPSFYNSNPHDACSLSNGDILILSSGQVVDETFISNPEDPFADQIAMLSKSGCRLIKMNLKGDVLLDTVFLSDHFHFLWPGEIKATSDGGFVLIGSTTKGDLIADRAAVYKFDKNFKKEWVKEYQWKKDNSDWEDNNWGMSICPLKDGGYILGIINQYSELEHRLTKIDEQGKEIWSVNFDGEILDGYKVLETSEGDYLMAGIPEDTKVLVLRKISDDGKLLWEKTYESKNKVMDFKDIIETKDGRYAMIARTGGGESGIFFVCTDKHGNVKK